MIQISPCRPVTAEDLPAGGLPRPAHLAAPQPSHQPAQTRTERASGQQVDGQVGGGVEHLGRL